MITIEAVLDESGLLAGCDVRGHAGAGKRGEDIVCAAVSVLCRTALAILSEKEGIAVRGGPGGRGEFTLQTEAHSARGRDFLAAAGVFLLEGLESVAGEYPDNCTMTIRKERRN